MAIEIIATDAERALITALEDARQKTAPGIILQCRLSKLQNDLVPSDVANALQGALDGKDCSLFFCADGDVFLWWNGQASETIGQIEKTLCDTLKIEETSGFFRQYDGAIQRKMLQHICREKIHISIEKETAAPALTEADKQALAKQQWETFAQATKKRGGRSKPEIMIVEDVEITRKLLRAIIGNQYVCHMAADGAEAIKLYTENAPDIVFLDIELPDCSGHELASLFGKNDPDAYLIMATANHYESDINAAKENKVKGYAVKPLTLEKIKKFLDNYAVRSSR